MTHLLLPDGRCEHRWRNRTAHVVRCAWADLLMAFRGLQATAREQAALYPETAAFHEGQAYAYEEAIRRLPVAALTAEAFLRRTRDTIQSAVPDAEVVVIGGWDTCDGLPFEGSEP